MPYKIKQKFRYQSIYQFLQYTVDINLPKKSEDKIYNLIHYSFLINKSSTNYVNFTKKNYVNYSCKYQYWQVFSNNCMDTSIIFARLEHFLSYYISFVIISRANKQHVETFIYYARDGNGDTIVLVAYSYLYFFNVDWL